MKIRKLLIIPICIATSFMLTGCSGKDISRLIRIGSNLKNIADKNNDINNEEAISLSNRDKKILTNLFKASIMYTNGGVTDFINCFVYKDDIFNFEKNQKSEYSMGAITPELAIDIVYDGLGIKSNKEDFKLNIYGNIDIFGIDDESNEYYINKIIKSGEDEYRVYVNSVIYTVYGVLLSGSYEFNVIKNDESIFGYTVRGVKYCEEEEWVSEKVIASSTLNGDDNNFYDPENLIDNDKTTAWAEGADLGGIGEYVLFESSEIQKVSGACIDNGYLKSPELLEQNGAIKRVRFEFSDGSIVESNLNPVLVEDDYVDYYSYTDYINFGREIETTYIKMTILETSVGSTNEDTYVSEIKFVK